jgi:hypothetical protein
MPKRYLIANTNRVELPTDFIYSKKTRHIYVLNVKLYDIATGTLLMDVSMHTDFIKDLPYRNGFVCFCNEQLAKRKKYEIEHFMNTFNVWFEDLSETVLDPLTYKFTAEFMLDY